MLQKKICMLGAYAVGKTSLVSRYVTSMFSEKYLSTVGVKIDKKTVEYGGETVMLMLWDIYGEDSMQKVQMSYLKGTSGYLLVADATRRETLDKAVALHERAGEVAGNVPFLLVVNKSDLVTQIEIDDTALRPLIDSGWTVLRGSAKTGEGVEEAFSTLTGRLVGG
ncbi:MAG: GTP-binding protein [Acidobacteria bacterium]|nr:GTP-binding protein [Acidobacteriota bacterium]